MSEQTMKHVASSIGFLIGLIFDPEDEGDMFLRKIVQFSTEYKINTPGDMTLFQNMLVI
jgi:hypothetical protein